MLPTDRPNLDLEEFGGIEDIIAALERRLVGVSVLATLMIVAGSDYRFGEVLRGGLAIKTGKVGSGTGDLVVSLTPTRKAIAEVKRFNPGTLLVGTKLEADVDADELARASSLRPGPSWPGLRSGPGVGCRLGSGRKAGEPGEARSESCLPSRKDQPLRGRSRPGGNPSCGQGFRSRS